MAGRGGKKRTSGRRGKRAGAAPQPALPALSTLLDVPAFADLTPSERQRAAFEEAREAACAEGRDVVLGCVVRLDRGFPAVACESGLVRAEFAARLTKGEFSRVAVGDWVVVGVPEGHTMAIIDAILPRESDVARWRGGARGERQTLAANVDVVLVVQALSERGTQLERIVRSAVIARDCGTHAAVVLTKADLAGPEGTSATIAEVREVLGGEVSVAVCASPEAAGAGLAQLEEATRAAGGLWGLDGVRGLVPEGRIGIVLGESGAGKSTMLNALLGKDVLETGAVRAADGAGRHTTVARRMVKLPGAGIIVDEPGLRSLPLVGHEHGLALVFPEVADAALGCRFRDCTHTHEPGCAVTAAVQEGACSKRRADAYITLANTMREAAGTLDPDVRM